jgi:DNA-binding HxlR family transcriptional regulator
MEKRIKTEERACPVGGAINAFGGKWKPEIIYYLNISPRRFNELRRLIPRVTQRMLTQQLRELERDGIINRKQYMEIPPRVVYSLTELGLSLTPIFEFLEDWSKRNTARIEKARASYDLSKKTAPPKRGST